MNLIKLETAGMALNISGKVLILLHGRGGSAGDMLGLAGRLNTDGYSLYAPEAVNHTWYPSSFLRPVAENEPSLTMALDFLHSLVEDLELKGIPRDKIFFLGFSQGACLTLEFTARNASRYGGIIAFTGGLIGDQPAIERYKGDFKQTPVFIGTSDPDMHVPVERVETTAAQLLRMNAKVMTRIYPNMGHTINRDEIGNANQLLSGATFSDL